MTDRQSNLSGEDSLIARYFRPLATDPGAFGLMDDAAILKASGDDTVATTAAIVEGVHFLTADPPHPAARKPLRANFPAPPPTAPPPPAPPPPPPSPPPPPPPPPP